MSNKKYNNLTNKLIKHKILIIFFILLLLLLGIKGWEFIQKEKEYVPQYEMEWYVDKLSKYFDNISLGHIYDEEGLYHLFIFYFTDNPGISVYLGSYTLELLFSEDLDSEYPSTINALQQEFNCAVNKLYYTSVVYEDFSTYIDNLIPNEINYSLRMELGTYVGEHDIVEFNPDSAWKQLKSNEFRKHFMIYILVDKTSVHDELDLQRILDETYQYAYEYFYEHGIEDITIMINGAETVNFEDYPQFNLKYFFDNQSTEFYDSILRKNQTN